MRKPNHLGRTVRQLREAGKIDESPIVRIENRELNDEEKATIAKRQEEQAARLARIAARAKGKTS
jgi:hypothetical protein